MAYVTITTSVEVKTPPQAAQGSDNKFTGLPMQGTIDPATNRPIITLSLPGRDVTGDISYWNRIKSAGGVPGLDPRQASLLSEFLQTKFSKINELNNDTAASYKEWLGPDTEAPGTTTSNETKTLPDGTKVTTTTTRSVGTEANPTAQASDNPQNPAAAAREPQLTGSADDDIVPNKRNTVDGIGPNDPGQEAPIGPDGLQEVTVTGRRIPSEDDLQEVVVTARRPAAGKPGRRTYNPLAQLASYTYNITLYMVTPDAYEAFVQSGRKKIDALSKAISVSEAVNAAGGIGGGAFIVAQSGGVSNNSNRIPTNKVDYFIDNLRFTTLTNTKTTQAPVTGVSQLSFQITEPYGFSFISDLKRAGEALKAYSASSTYKNMYNSFRNFFILGIRFYGYDVDGRLVKGSDKRYGTAIDPLGGDALFENFYDLVFSTVNFKLTGDAVIYNISATSINGQALLGIKRGRMPQGVKVQAATVKDALMGPNGLFTGLNKKEVERVNTKTQKLKNEFDVVFLGEAEQLIKEASLVSDADLAKYRWGDTGSEKTIDVNDSKNASPPKPEVRMFTFNHDTSIISAIETIIKKSAYMVDALKTVYANVKQPNTDQKDYEKTEKEPATIRWFNISANIVKADWDDVIGDWAYKMVYTIQIYDIPSMETPYSQAARKYYGPHKKYEYWFTGQNSEILDFSFNFDNLYFNAALGLDKIPTDSAATKNGGRETTSPGSTANNSGPSAGNSNTTSGNNGLKEDSPPEGSEDKSGSAKIGGEVAIKPDIRQNADKTAGRGISLESQNSVETYLNDLGAYYTGRMRILGDPDFLIRDAAVSVNSLYNQFYDTNGFTINAQGGQVFIEVKIKEGKDYRIKSGLQEINESILFLNYPPEVKAISNNSIIYMVSQVDSVMQGGRFEQTLELIGATFPGTNPVVPNQQSSSPAESSNRQETATTPQGSQVANDDSSLQPVSITSRRVVPPDQARENELQEVQVTGRRVNPPPTTVPTTTPRRLGPPGD